MLRQILVHVLWPNVAKIRRVFERFRKPPRLLHARDGARRRSPPVNLLCLFSTTNKLFLFKFFFSFSSSFARRVLAHFVLRQLLFRRRRER
jgi:hypothetical protein